MTQVLRVARWRDVFETADSRRHKVLTWISVPIKFNSTGYQSLLESFEEGLEAAAVYGAWCALLKVAGTSVVRGVLAGSKGEPYTVRRLARITSLPERAFELLLPWAERVGWLERVNWSEIADQPTNDSHSFGERQPNELPDRTQPDRTLPNQIPDRSGGEPVRSVGLDYVPDWPELAGLGTPIAVTREQCEARRPGLIEATEGSVFARGFDFGNYVKFPERGQFWHAIQSLLPSPVVGATVAHQVLVMAACLHAAKVPQAQVRRSRSGLLIGILKDFENPNRWDASRVRIPRVIEHANADPINALMVPTEVPTEVSPQAELLNHSKIDQFREKLERHKRLKEGQQ